MAIELTNIGLQINNVRLLENINLTIKRGETVGLVGPNGSGKTTLLKLIGRYYEGQYSGAISRGDTIYLSDDIPVVFPYLVKDFFEVKKKSDLSLEILDSEIVNDIKNLFHKKMKQLSHGERIRCLLAWGLMQKPEALLLDETLAGLDPGWLSFWNKKLKEISSKNEMIVMCVSHQIDFMTHFAPRILAIRHHHIVYDLPPDQIANPAILEAIYRR